MHGLCRQHKLLLKIKLISVRFFTSGTTLSCRNSYDFTDLLHLCKTTKCIQNVHSQIITGGFSQNPFVAAKLVGKYCENGGSNMDNARKVFDGLLDRSDIFLWNMVIQGYASLGPHVEAVNKYGEMRLSGVCPNRYTYTFVIKACAALRDGKKGRMLHGHIFKCGFDDDVFVGNALLAFYAKCHEIDISRKVFDEIPQRDIVSWNSMISGYTVNGYADEALTLFSALLQDDSVPDPDYATLIAVLGSCAQAAALQVGCWIHSYITKTGMEVDAALGSGLISTYANCGHISIAREVFDRVSDKNIVVWNAMIKCYGNHGYADEALKMFSRLVNVGLKPDGVMFLCLLSACSHAGMVAKGRELFDMMEDYAVEKFEEHYACMVDLLGRAGHLDEAANLIRSIPLQPGKNVYGALLGAARIHNNIELAEEAAEKLFVLDPKNAGRYIILAKMYEDAEQWEDAARVRTLMREKEVRKPIGCSSIELDCVTHTFGVEDESHPFRDQIFDTLKRLETLMDN